MLHDRHRCAELLLELETEMVAVERDGVVDVRNQISHRHHLRLASRFATARFRVWRLRAAASAEKISAPGLPCKQRAIAATTRHDGAGTVRPGRSGAQHAPAERCPSRCA